MSEYFKKCVEENRRPVDQSMFKAKGHVEYGQTWAHKKTSNTIEVDCVRVLGAYYVYFYEKGKLKSLVRGKFLKLYKRLEL